jgi:hypothetical protein
MVDKLDYNPINELIKEYFAAHGMDSALESFIAEEKSKQLAVTQAKRQPKQLNKVPLVRTLCANF